MPAQATNKQTQRQKQKETKTKMDAKRNKAGDKPGEGADAGPRVAGAREWWAGPESSRIPGQQPPGQSPRRCRHSAFRGGTKGFLFSFQLKRKSSRPFFYPRRQIIPLLTTLGASSCSAAGSCSSQGTASATTDSCSYSKGAGITVEGGVHAREGVLLAGAPSKTGTRITPVRAGHAHAKKQKQKRVQPTP